MKLLWEDAKRDLLGRFISLKVGQCFQPVNGCSAMRVLTGWKHFPTLNCHEKRA